MTTFLSLAYRVSHELPKEFHGDDIRYSETLVEHFLEEFTEAGDYVLDPFAGFGTTLVVAERMGRIPFGVEIDRSRVEYARSLLSSPERMIHGDSRHLSRLDLPKFSFSLTSPPYMTKSDHPQDPLTGYASDGTGYADYLLGLREIYEQLKIFLLPAASVVLEVSNIKSDREITPLAWDIATELSTVFSFRGEVVIGWDTPSYEYDHSYCLVFDNTA